MITKMLRTKVLHALLEVNSLFTAWVWSCSLEFCISCKRKKPFKLTSASLKVWKIIGSACHLFLKNVHKSATKGVSEKKLLSKILWYSQKNICVGVSFGVNLSFFLWIYSCWTPNLINICKRLLLHSVH